MKKIKNIQEIKEIQLGILRYVHTTCEENGLAYFLCAGTLLGAVRHKGYIPWDDDVDVMMPRKDYEKLIKIINADKKSPFQAITYKNCPDFGRAFAKVSDSRTVLLSKGFYRIKKLGVNIDVFPYDYLPESKTEIREAFKRISVLRKHLYTLGINNGKPSACMPKWLFPFVYLFCSNLDAIAKKYSAHNSDKVACFTAVKLGETEITDRAVFDKRILSEFENEQFYIIERYHEYLTDHYGDYMTLPPVSQRRNKHRVVGWWR